MVTKWENINDKKNICIIISAELHSQAVPVSPNLTTESYNNDMTEIL